LSEKEKIKVDFGVPEHGWLPINLNYIDFDLALYVSDVPVDPMLQLSDALIQICKGVNQPDSIIWHLEPYCYYLKFEARDSDYRVTILESAKIHSPTKLTLEIEGAFEEVVLPFYREVKKFWSKNHKPPNWNELEDERINELTKLIKNKRA